MFLLDLALQMIDSFKSWLKALLSNSSDVSAMRVMSFIALFAGIYLAIDGLRRDEDLMGLTALISVFVGAAFGGKVAQKAVESKQKED